MAEIAYHYTDYECHVLCPYLETQRDVKVGSNYCRMSCEYGPKEVSNFPDPSGTGSGIITCNHPTSYTQPKDLNIVALI